MKKENWALGLSIVAMTIAIIATCIAAYRTPELGFDYQGVIVGILSLLVTVLIGWNIYTFIDIKGTSQKIDKFRAEFEGKIKKSSLETQFDVKKGNDESCSNSHCPTTWRFNKLFTVYV